ncbi:uncharacterized protein LOC129588288 [Paramacrobiotus metropolitanus]|uniref:uncharacterized protein LOC129588288 n=1 Tax=Paramacrobiotus metropolitanus TaxID=2943436 RepID=UPI002445A2A9|nr:uncharacterized protein LOC129588288 [Paramacrobiotus metropolitanus]
MLKCVTDRFRRNAWSRALQHFLRVIKTRARNITEKRLLCQMSYSIADILTNVSNQSKLTIKLHRLRFASILLGICSFVLVGAFETGDWLHYFDQDPRRRNFQYDLPLDPLPVRFPIWQYVILWTVWTTLLFALSQQMYIGLILHTTLIQYSLQDIRDSLEKESTHLHFLSKTGKAKSSDLCEHVYENLKTLKTRYFQIGLEINLQLHTMVESGDALPEVQLLNRFKKVLQALLSRFLNLVRDHPVIFSGADMFHVTRNFLAGTFTFVLSCAIVLKEFIQRTDEILVREYSCNTTGMKLDVNVSREFG